MKRDAARDMEYVRVLRDFAETGNPKNLMLADALEYWIREAQAQKTLSPSQVCAKYHVQNCHACERADCGDNMTPGIVALRAKLEEAREENERMRAGLLAVETLINSSRGVCGLHLNGDEAPWEELRSGGYFEQWLYELDEALDFIKRDNPGSAGKG